MVSLEFRILPAFTGYTIVVFLAPYAELLPTKPVLPHPIWATTHPSHGGNVLFRKVKHNPHKICWLSVQVLVLQSGRVSRRKRPLDTKSTIAFKHRLNHITFTLRVVPQMPQAVFLSRQLRTRK